MGNLTNAGFQETNIHPALEKFDYWTRQKMISSVVTFGALLSVPFLFLNAEAQSIYAASMSNAPVGIYSREGGLFGDSAYLASLGGAPVGAYSRQRNPVFVYPLVRTPVVIPSQLSVHRRPIRPRPRPPIRPAPSKPAGVSGRSGGLLGGLLGGLFR